jgi:hypothetical protein
VPLNSPGNPARAQAVFSVTFVKEIGNGNKEKGSEKSGEETGREENDEETG